MFKFSKLPRTTTPTMVEVFKLKHEGDVWNVVRGGDLGPPGFEFARKGAAEPRLRKGWLRGADETHDMKSVWGPGQVMHGFEKKEVEMGNAPPPPMTPKDVTDAILGKDIPGIRVEPGVLQDIIKYAAGAIVQNPSFGEYDFIVPMPSSKPAALQLAQEIGKLSGKKVIQKGVLKQTNPEQIKIDWTHVKPEARNDPEFVKEVEQTLRRMKEKIKATGSFKARASILKQFSRMFKGYHEPGEDILETEGKKILLVDDFTATGASMNDARKVIHDLGPGFNVIGMACIFIMQTKPK